MRDGVCVAGVGLTGASVGGDAADQVSAPGFHGDGVEPPRRQRREVALVVSGGDALVLQDAVVVPDQNHVTVQISGRVTPGNLKTTEEELCFTVNLHTLYHQEDERMTEVLG